MVESFFSQTWYRVASLKLRLAPQLVTHRHRYGPEVWYVLEDRVTGKVHRLSPAAHSFVWRLDGRTTVEEAWITVSKELSTKAPSQDQVIQLLSQLYQTDLLIGEKSPDLAEQDRRGTKQARRYKQQALISPMSLRVPLFNPDRFLSATVWMFKPFIGWFGLLAMLVLFVLAGLEAGKHWDELTTNLPDRVLSADNLLILLLVYPVVKTFHEFAHGYTAKRFGAPVNEMGIMFLVFFPVPYVDATAVGAFRHKHLRIAVSAAGILAELVLASIAMLLWSRMEPGFERALWFNVMLIGGVSTILVNGNPLLKFDGYYIFADLMETPNLDQRAKKFCKKFMETFVFGLKDEQKEPAARHEKWLLALYAPLSFIYRIFIMAGIGLFVATEYFAVGAALALWMLGQTLAWPVLKGVWYLMSSPKLRQNRLRANTLIWGGLTAVVSFLYFIPLPSWYVGQGVVWLPEEAHVRAKTGGFAKAVTGKDGDRISKGSELLNLEDPNLAAQLNILEWKLRELEQKRFAAANDAFLLKTLEVEIETARKNYEVQRSKQTELNVAARYSGNYEPVINEADIEGRYVQDGTLVGHILPERARTVRAVVLQDQVDKVRNHLTGVKLLIPGEVPSEAETVILREVPAANFELPSAAFSITMGGDIATDPRDGENLTALNRVFVFDLELPERATRPAFGQRVSIKYRFGNETGFEQLMQLATRLLSDELGI